MTSQTITIPAREVRPGDVLFGMTVTNSQWSTYSRDLRWLVLNSFDLWLANEQQVTVERPVPSDPIGTVRAAFSDGMICALYEKDTDGFWRRYGSQHRYSDADVFDQPILWKPGMPIPNTEVTA